MHSCLTERNPDSWVVSQDIPGAAERLTFFKASLMEPGSYDAACAGAACVIHMASPLVSGGTDDGENVFIKPAVEGTVNVLQSCVKGGVQFVVLTSSMSAIAPKPEPEVKDEVSFDVLGTRFVNPVSDKATHPLTDTLVRPRGTEGARIMVRRQQDVGGTGRRKFLH